MYDVVIIGSGIAGLTTAAILAQHGQRVLVLEKSPSVAPVLRGFSRHGVHFDTGFHYAGGLEDGGILDRFLRYLGIASRVEKYAFATERFDVFRDSGGRGEFRFPIGYEPLNEALCVAYPDEREAIGQYLAAVKAASRQFPYLELDADFGEQGLLASVNGPSLKEFLDQLIGNAELKTLLTLHTLLHGVPAEEVSFAFHAAVVGGYYQSVHGLKGGGLSLVNAFQGRLAELGVDLYSGRAAKRIVTAADGSVTGVEVADGEVFACRSCVSTVHPEVFLDLLSSQLLRPVYRRRLLDLEETVSAFMLYGVCKSPVPSLQGTNLFLGQLEKPPYGLVCGELEDRIFYLTGSAPGANQSARSGFVAICPARQASTARWASSRRENRPDDYLHFKQETMGRMQRHIEVCCPDLRGKFEIAAGATPLTMSDFAANPRGGLYGAKHKIGQYNPMSVTRVPGLFLAGQAVAAPGVLGGMLSAFLTCGHILGHERLRRGVKECI